MELGGFKPGRIASFVKNPVFIGVAWPYANGGLHLGHVAGSLLPPDIFRRYKRMQGHDVLMVSGSDCHGTPVMLKAEQEGRTPQELVDHFHADHARALERLSIDFDLFTQTTTANHEKYVQEIFTACLEQGFIEKRTQQAPFDPVGGRFLPDRYVEGTCPHCEFPDARGDQCDNCGKTLDPQDLKTPRSKLNPEAAIEFRDTDHFFFLLGKLQPALEKYVAGSSGHWRPNAINFTQNWLNEGLQDRAITRDLTWGIKIPLDGYDDKRIYVWFEAVCGYLTAAIQWANETGNSWEHWWTNPETKSYYFLGKDNIPFHTIIWPAIITAYNGARAAANQPLLVMPYDVPANEFLNLDGQQFSKSRGISIAVHDVLDRFESDAVRYYLSVNMPEQRDSDWTWDDFLSKVNDELVGTIGNLVHRIASFTQKNLGEIPAAADSQWNTRVDALLASCEADMSNHMDKVQLKKAVRRLLEFAGDGNALMQEAAPWKLLKTDPEACAGALYALMRLIKGLGVFMAPYTPTASKQIWNWLGEKGEPTWNPTAPLQSGHKLEVPRALFQKLDAKDIPQPEEKTMIPEEDLVTIDDFAKLQLRIGVITSAEDHPKADKLFVLKVDGGDIGERQIVAGLKGHYEASELAGQTVAFIANLKPVKLRGIESQGMILAADNGDIVTTLNPNRNIPAGSNIR
jgi:methionyl-tRNA synthetase